MDQRCAGFGAPHLSGGGVPAGERSAAPFVRPRPRRADLDARIGLSRARLQGGVGHPAGSTTRPTTPSHIGLAKRETRTTAWSRRSPSVLLWVADWSG